VFHMFHGNLLGFPRTGHKCHPHLGYTTESWQKSARQNDVVW
jgi:hypothetical protein